MTQAQYYLAVLTWARSGESYRTLALRLGVSEATVRRRLRRVRCNHNRKGAP